MAHRLFFDVENGFMGVQADHLKGDERAQFADASRAHRDVYQRAFSLTVSTEGDVFSFRGQRSALVYPHDPPRPALPPGLPVRGHGDEGR